VESSSSRCLNIRVTGPSDERFALRGHAPGGDDGTGSTRAAHWESIWSQRRPETVSWYQSVPRTSLDLVTRYARPEDRVLDVGGGASRLVDLLLQRSYRRLAVLDVSPAALDHARARLGPGAEAVDWIVADVTNWCPTVPVELWHDRAVFHFLVEPAERAAYVAAAGNGIAPGGHLVVATFALDGPEMCSGLPVQRYDAAGLAAAFGPDFDLVETATERHVTPTGADQPFVYVVLRRR